MFIACFLDTTPYKRVHDNTVTAFKGCGPCTCPEFKEKNSSLLFQRPRLNPEAPQVARLCYPVSILTGPSQLCDLPLHLRFSDKHICHWFCGLPGSSRKILSEILYLDFSLRRSYPALGELGRVGISEGGHHSTGCFTQRHPIPSHWVWLQTIGMPALRRTGLEGR